MAYMEEGDLLTEIALAEKPWGAEASLRDWLQEQPCAFKRKALRALLKLKGNTIIRQHRKRHARDAKSQTLLNHAFAPVL